MRPPAPRGPVGAHGALVPFGLALLAGWIAGLAAEQRRAGDCRRQVPDGGRVRVEGVVQERSVPEKRSVAFWIGPGLGDCSGPVTLIRPRRARMLEAGGPVTVHGRWGADEGGPGPARYVLFADSVGASDWHSGVRGRLYRARGSVAQRVAHVFPRRRALVEALILAQKAGLDADVRDAFAVAGLAHLLAISGFHVGVIAGLLLTVAAVAGLSPTAARATASSGVWVYVSVIGLPDAAVRAALLLTIATWARVRARPIHAVGGLAAAWLIMVLFDPDAPRRIGFQLSFAGALGLAVGSRSIDALLRRGATGALPRAVRSALAAGTAATLCTLPLVAWHFERVSIIGIPATLLIGPLIALAIPGVLGSLLLSVVWAAPARFLAGGVEWLLDATLLLTEILAGIPGASVWVPRTWVPAGAVGALLAASTATRWFDARGRGRRALVAAGCASAVIAWPVVLSLGGGGTAEVVVLDVGQGDAIGIRSPRGRWILIDAGPSSGFDAGARIVVPYLRRRGVRRLSALILTHPDLDHIGGAPAVFEHLEVDAVFDPGVPEGRPAYVAALELAALEGAPWLPMTVGRVLDLDGVVLRAAHPPGAAEHSLSSNDRSVVLELRYRDFTMLLTGDAERDAEERIVRNGLVTDVDVLKVGHHGSATSSTAPFLDRIRAEVAIVPVGRRNRYGHPDADVLARLRERGIAIYRTDLDGTVRVVVDRRGRYSVLTER